jgi:hypothetical protein
VAEVTGAHSDIGPELRKLAQKILDQIDPAVRLAASMAVGDGAGTGKCQQAVVSGDEHPLLTVIAEHSVALLAVIRAIVDQVDQTTPTPPTPPPDGPPGGRAEPEAAADPRPTTRYQPISVTVDE